MPIPIRVTWVKYHQRTTLELDQYDTELSCSVIELSLSTSTKRSQSQAFSLQVQYRKSLGEHCNAACGVPFLSHSVSPFVSTILARIRYANINARQTIEDDFQKSLFTKNTFGSPPIKSIWDRYQITGMHILYHSQVRYDVICTSSGIVWCMLCRNLVIVMLLTVYQHTVCSLKNDTIPIQDS